MKKKINKYDISLILAIIIINIFILFLSGNNLVHVAKTEALVYSENKLVGQYVLDEDYKNEFTVTVNEGYNTIKIEGGRIWVSDTDCPDKYCELQGKISVDGEIIVCLPHKLVVKIVGNENSEIDFLLK